jgi:hypothetical protein
MFFLGFRDVSLRCLHTKFEQNRTDDEQNRSTDCTVHTLK